MAENHNRFNLNGEQQMYLGLAARIGLLILGLVLLGWLVWYVAGLATNDTPKAPKDKTSTGVVSDNSAQDTKKPSSSTDSNGNPQQPTPTPRPSTPAPTPTPTPQPAPQPTTPRTPSTGPLPNTGPADTALSIISLAVAAGAISAYRRSRRQLATS